MADDAGVSEYSPYALVKFRFVQPALNAAPASCHVDPEMDSRGVDMGVTLIKYGKESAVTANDLVPRPRGFPHSTVMVAHIRSGSTHHELFSALTLLAQSWTTDMFEVSSFYDPISPRLASHEAKPLFLPYLSRGYVVNSASDPRATVMGVGMTDPPVVFSVLRLTTRFKGNQGYPFFCLDPYQVGNGA